MPGVVTGCNGVFPVKDADLFMGNAGTAIRPLTAALALSGGHYRLSGVPRMHERPIGDLVDGLLQIGADLRYYRQSGLSPAGGSSGAGNACRAGAPARRRVLAIPHGLADGACL
jgi:5-enolpyruvylshikimate-3-phosphate synthase